MTMTGSVRHLSLVSLSLGAGRRSADMPSPGRDQGPLDPATKVLEMESLGVKVGSCLYAYIPAESTHSVQSWHNTGLLIGMACPLCTGSQCEALLGAEPNKHGIQLCLGGC